VELNDTLWSNLHDKGWNFVSDWEKVREFLFEKRMLTDKNEGVIKEEWSKSSWVMNLTGAPTTEELAEMRVVDPAPSLREQVRALTEFTDVPHPTDVSFRCSTLSMIVSRSPYWYVLIDGPNYFCSVLEQHLMDYGVVPMYLYEVREEMEDGTIVIKKVNKLLESYKI